jgi:voltage-gated potassium channel
MKIVIKNVINRIPKTRYLIFLFVKTLYDKSFLSKDVNTKKEYFVAGITLVSVIVILYQYLERPTGQALNLIYMFDLIVAGILSIDFYIRAKESKQRGRFVAKHAYEIPAMIPLLVFGIFESQSVFNVVIRGLRLIRLFRLIQLISRTSHILERTGNRLIYTAAFSALAVSSGAVGIYVVEHNIEGTKITNMGDAFWWAIVTVTTVGYGDVYPITAEGRLIAAFLMIVGIAILGILISTLGAGLIESRLRPKPKLGEDAKNKIKEAIDNLELLKKDEVDTLIANIGGLHKELQNTNKEYQIYCKVCGQINPEKSLFCNQCGAGDVLLAFRYRISN